MTDVPVPGDNHPAVEQYASAIAGADHYHYRVPVPPVASASVVEPDASTVMDTMILEFTAEKAAQSLYPEYGYYVWKVWRDQYGRHVTEPEATWVENPQGFMYGEWNPVRRRGDE